MSHHVFHVLSPILCKCISKLGDNCAVLCLKFWCELQFLVEPVVEKGGSISQGGCLNLVGFCLFECCVGLFWPSIMKMRSQYIPEESRSTIMNFFRIPLNIFVCIVLYNVSTILNLFPVILISPVWYSSNVLSIGTFDCHYVYRMFRKFSDSTECFRWVHFQSVLCLECAQYFWQWLQSFRDDSWWYLRSTTVVSQSCPFIFYSVNPSSSHTSGLRACIKKVLCW